MIYWHKIKVFVTDALGVILILTAIFFGWLPGIGGIPLFIAGLALLAHNHDWAKRWLDLAKQHSSRLWDIIFTNNPILMHLNDALALIFAVWGVWMIVEFSGYFYRTASFILISISLTLFFGNRKRLANILKKIQRKP